MRFTALRWVTTQHPPSPAISAEYTRPIPWQISLHALLTLPNSKSRRKGTNFKNSRSHPALKLLRPKINEDRMIKTGSCNPNSIRLKSREHFSHHMKTPGLGWLRTPWIHLLAPDRALLQSLFSSRGSWPALVERTPPLLHVWQLLLANSFSVVEISVPPLFL